jgi:hypothetical protein
MVGVVSPEVSMVEAAFFCEGEERFGGFFGYEGQVDLFSGEGPLVGAAEHEQCVGEVDRAGVDGAEAFVELAGVAAARPGRPLSRPPRWSRTGCGRNGRPPRPPS